ncbi:MAG: hypothetical protein R3Y29_07570 [bacterium]
MSLKNKLNNCIDIEKIERESEQNTDKIELEKNDGPAIIIAGFLVFTPVIILVSTFFYALVWFIYLR